MKLALARCCGTQPVAVVFSGVAVLLNAYEPRRWHDLLKCMFSAHSHKAQVKDSVLLAYITKKVRQGSQATSSSLLPPRTRKACCALHNHTVLCCRM